MTIASRQHLIPLVALERTRANSRLRRLASQRDHDLVVKDLDVTGTGFTGGLRVDSSLRLRRFGAVDAPMTRSSAVKGCIAGSIVITVL
jgi:hypothetical protein